MLLAASEDLSDLIYRSQEEIERLQELLAAFELQDLVTIVERLCNTAPRMKLASDPRVLLESVLVDLALLDRQVQLRELIERLESGGGTKPSPAPATGGSRGRSTTKPPAKGAASAGDEFGGPTHRAEAPASAPEPAPAPEPQSPPPSPTDVDLSTLGYADLRRLWDGFVTTVRQKKVALGVCLISGSLKSIEGDTVYLRFAKGFGFQRQQVEEASNKKFLLGMIQKYFGRELELVCFTEGEEAKVAAERAQATREAEAEKIERPIESQPMVKKILTEFDGEIVRYHPQ